MSSEVIWVGVGVQLGGGRATFFVIQTTPVTVMGDNEIGTD